MTITPSRTDIDDRASLAGADPVRVIASVVAAPLLAEAVIAIGDLEGGVALVIRLAGIVAAAAAVISLVVRPLLAAVAQARIVATDIEEQLLDERADRDFRDRFDRAITTCDTEPSALRIGLRAVTELLPDHEVALLLVAPDQPRVAWSVRMSDGSMRPAEPVPGTPGCVALSSGATASSNTSGAVGACAHLADTDVEVSSVCIPFRLGDRLLGTVCVTSAPGELPDARALSSVEWVVERTGARVAERRRLRGPSTPGPEDPVTGLPTEVALRSHLRDLVRAHTPFCMAVVRMDGEEDYRAEHPGDHDEALRLLADAVVSTLRPDDVVCRLDGSRFAAVLQSCTARQASAAMERVREALVLSLTLEQVEHFTCSVGIVESHRATSLDETVNLADAASEAANLQGGNRVAVAQPD